MSKRIKIPNIGLVYSRDQMPQISKESIPGFKKYLDRNGIDSESKTVDTSSLKSSQMDFDKDKVRSLMKKKTPGRIITSTDGHVIDGHHRWIADHNTKGKVPTLKVDVPVLKLLRIAHDYAGSIKESCDNPMDSFIQFASDYLGIKSIPQVSIIDQEPESRSFGGYNPGTRKILVVTKGRHPMDVYRTVAHELVHHKQNEDKKLCANSGDTGSDIENEANALAGVIMRNWAKENPGDFHSSGISESLAIIVVGGPCSGKDLVSKSIILEGLGFQEVNSSKLTLKEKMVVNLPTSDSNSVIGLYKLLESNGYLVSVVFVNTTNEISRLRNEQRVLRGQRVIDETIRFQKYVQFQNNVKEITSLLGEEKVISLDNSNISSNREEGTKTLVRIYKRDTPGQTSNNDYTKSFSNDGIGQTTGGLVRSAGGYGSSFSVPVNEWLNNPAVIHRFTKKYGNDARSKMLMIAEALDKSPKKLLKNRRVKEQCDLDLDNKRPPFKTEKDSIDYTLK